MGNTRVILELGNTKLEGFGQCWILLEPEYGTIHDLSTYLLDVFDLHNDFSSGLLISRNGRVLPPWEPTIFEDNDTIQVECAPSNYSESLEMRLYYRLNKFKKNEFGNDVESFVLYEYAKQQRILITDEVNVMREHHLQRVDKEIIQHRLESFSKLAVEYYNNASGTEFELVESLICQSFCFEGFWYHLNFKAKPKSADSSVDLSPKLFFAEVFEILVPKVTVCCILEPENAVLSCGICEPYDRDETKVCHPSSDVGQASMTESGLPVARAGLSSEMAKKEAEQEFALYLNQALEDYNKLHSSEYVSGFELVKVVSWYAFPGAGEWYHLNFEVKLKNAYFSNQPTSELFFAEIFKCVGQPVVTSCRGVNVVCGSQSCGTCKSNDGNIVYHPRNGYRAGGVGLER